MEQVYLDLAQHLEGLVMGFPQTPDLPALLQEMFTPQEASVALAIPASGVRPLEAADLSAIQAASSLPPEVTATILADLAARGLIYSAPLAGGRVGYGLLQVGYGLPQSFFWAGPSDQRAQNLARRVIKYFTTPVTGQVYGSTPTKTFRYAPASLAVPVDKQGVLLG